ncbi:MAG: hypothetical protein ACRC47_14830 [Shewanella sp.]
MENLIGKDKALFLDKLALAQPILSPETVRMINFIMGEDSDCDHASPIRECAFFVIGRLYPVQGCQINDLIEAAKKVVGIK